MSDPKPTQFGPNGEAIVPMRLQKFLARAGAASRRGSENLMTAGRVRERGKRQPNSAAKWIRCAMWSRSTARWSCACSIRRSPSCLNKPAGYLTTMSDPHGRPCVASLVPTDRFPGLFPVGRLDMDTTGLLLFSTDGELGNSLLHPRYHVDKTYHARVAGIMSQEQAQVLERGIELDDGLTLPAQVRIERIAKGKTDVEITIHEGKRQGETSCSAVGLVVQMHRSNFGPLSLGELPEGAWRVLSGEEVKALKQAAGIEAPSC